MNNLKKSNTNLLKPFLCGILISGIMVSSMTFTNAASFSTGPVSYYTANGITYNTYNTIYTGKNAYNQKYANAMMTANAKNQATLRIPVSTCLHLLTCLKFRYPMYQTTFSPQYI